MNTEIYYPKSGKTVAGASSTDKSFTSPANGEGSIVYLAARIPDGGNGSASVFVNGVPVATYYAIDLPNFVDSLQTGMVNVLSPKKLFWNGTSDPNATPGFFVFDPPNAFPVDKNGSPYLMLGPGDTVQITSNGGPVCITALDL